MDIGIDTTSSDDGFTQQLVELLVVADGELHVAWDDALSLVVTSGVSRQLKNLCDQVLEYSSHVDWCISTQAGSHAPVTHVACNAANWEL